MGEGEGNPNNTHGLERSPRKWSVFVDLKTHSGITQDTEKKRKKGNQQPVKLHTNWQNLSVVLTESLG